jgi:hypothetical protein
MTDGMRREGCAVKSQALTPSGKRRDGEHKPVAMDGGAVDPCRSSLHEIVANALRAPERSVENRDVTPDDPG